MTVYLTAQQVLFIHARLIETTGGEPGIRDLSLLESAVARPQATFEGAELYSDLFSKVAALTHSLIQNHPFVDGNKRTAVTAAGMFLWQNSYQLLAPNTELENFVLKIVNDRLDVAEVAEWLDANSKLFE